MISCENEKEKLVSNLLNESKENIITKDYDLISKELRKIDQPFERKEKELHFSKEFND